MNPFPTVARGTLNPGGDSEHMTAAVGIPSPPPMSLRHYLLWLTLAPLAFAIAWLLTWTLCELHPSEAFPSATMDTISEKPLVIPEEHTPGPWYAHRQDIQGNTIVFISNGTGLFSEEAHAVVTDSFPSLCGACIKKADGTLWPAESNARLIAAAPELLEALDHLAAFTGAVFQKLHIREDFQMTVGLKEGGEPRKTSFADVALRVATALCKARGQEPPAPLS